MVQVYAEPLCRRHYSSLISAPVFVRISLFLTAVAVSLVVAYATGGFWVKLRPNVDQPTVHYSGDALLMFEGSEPGSERIWSTSETINTQFSQSLIPATVQVLEEDLNGDGLIDIITLTASVQAEERVRGFKALVQFTYKYGGTVRLDMYTFAYLSCSSPIGGGALFTDGDLMFNQRNTITERLFFGNYNTPMLNSTMPTNILAVQGSNQLEFQNILKFYQDRNYTTVYENYNPVWRAGPGTSFEVTMRVRIPPNQVIFVRPTTIEMLKFGWIQFLATYIVAWWLFWWLQWFIFRYRVLPTRVVSDFQVKPQRF